MIAIALELREENNISGWIKYQFISSDKIMEKIEECEKKNLQQG
jgi:hypothetical protein